MFHTARRTGAALLLLCLPFASLPVSVAVAEEVKLTYQAVMHVHKSRITPVLDNKKHVIGVGTFRGLALFPDEEPALHRYDGWFDLNEGSGPFHGYALWTFADGATLSARYDGKVEMVEGDDAEVSATFHDFSGTGRFENVQGEGSFSGRRYESIQNGGATHLNGTLALRTSD
jgi:hypothetical protein